MEEQENDTQQTNMSQLIGALTGLINTLSAQKDKGKPNDTSIKEILQKSNSTFDSFDETVESFKLYSQRLKIFFKLKGLDDESKECEDAKTQVLINSIGAKHYKILASLCAPDLPADKSFDELITILMDHLEPKKNVLTNQHLFFSRMQSPTESNSEYIAVLKNMGGDCEFKGSCNSGDCARSVLNMLLRAQLIRGITDQQIRECILRQSDISFAEGVNTVLSIEASKVQSNDFKSTPQSINKVLTKSKLVNESRKEDNSSNNYMRGKVNLRELGLENRCLCCGRENHTARSCLVKHKLKCTHCNRQGHVEKVCIAARLKARSPNVNTILPVDDNSSEEVDLNLIVLKPNKLRVNSLGAPAKALITVNLNGSPQTFEVDSGSPVSLLSHSDFKKLGLKTPVKPSTVHFKSYTGNRFYPLGEVDIEIEYNSVKSFQTVYIVENSFSPLLGRSWIQGLNLDLNKIFKCSEEVKNVSNIEETQMKDQMTNKYAKIFQLQPTVGKIPDFRCSLKLKSDCKPRFVKPRTVSYSLLPKVNQELPKILSEFDFNIENRTSKLHKNVDYLSRQLLQANDEQFLYKNDDFKVNEEQVNFLTEVIPITSKEVKEATDQDDDLKLLKKQLMHGEILDSEYTVHEGIGMKGNRVIIPKALQSKVLQELHSTHVGIVKMKMLARSYCFWKGIDRDIENVVRSCIPCSQIINNPPKVPLHTWEDPSKPWTRIHKKTPSGLHCGRKLRTCLELIKPDINDNGNNSNSGLNVTRSFSPGERIQSRNYNGPPKWKPATIVKRLGRLHYLVQLDNGYRIKRHVNQLCNTSVDNEEIKSLPWPSILTDLTTLKPQVEKEIHNSSNKSTPSTSSTVDIKGKELSRSRTSQSQTRTYLPLDNQAIIPLASITPNLRRSSRIKRPVVKMDL